MRTTSKTNLEVGRRRPTGGRTMSSIFKLFSNVVPVRGAKRSSLCDLQRGRIKLIPNALFDILTKFPDRNLEAIKAEHDEADHGQIEAYFEFLVANEWGFMCDTPELFPDLALDYEPPAHITNAIIDVDEHSDHRYPFIRDQLDELGCRSLQIRVFSEKSREWLANLLEIFEQSRLRNLEIWMPYQPGWDQEALCRLIARHPRLFRLVLHGAAEARVRSSSAHKTMGLLVTVTETIESHHHCGQVDRSYFISELYNFAEAQHFNSCLNRKLAIDHNGQIRNCPSMPTQFGHVDQTPLAQAVARTDFRDVWRVTKDQVAVCKDCEFRYVCTDCRAYTQNDDPLGKPAKCGYDPYTAQWHDWRQPACIPV